MIKMRKTFLLTLMAIIIAASLQTKASVYYPHGIYLGADVGVSAFNLGKLKMKEGAVTLKDSKPGNKTLVAGSVKAGYALANLPLQFDLSYQQFLDFHYNAKPLFVEDSSNLASDITTRAVFANVTLNLPVNQRVIPFVTVGGGVANNSTDAKLTKGSSSSTKSVDEFSPAWQVGIGSHVKLTDNFLFNIAVKHQDLGKITWGPLDNNDYEFSSRNITNNQIVLGFSYVFGDQHRYHSPYLLAQ